MLASSFSITGLSRTKFVERRNSRFAWTVPRSRRLESFVDLPAAIAETCDAIHCSEGLGRGMAGNIDTASYLIAVSPTSSGRACRERTRKPRATLLYITHGG